jgi:uncharacterized membrane protein YphA (DoxX/SURF4 family)
MSPPLLLGRLARIVLALVLLAAGGLKGLDPHASVISVGAYHLLPARLVVILGVVLPAIEVFAGAALLMGFLVRGASLVAAGLGAVFAFGVTTAMVRGLDLDCGCFGSLSITPRAGLGTLSFDAGIIGLAILSYYSFRPRAAEPGA